jgi:DNA-binding transcriptional LysR family regulator
MNKFANIEAFIAVVETGTFSAAGERLSLAKSVVSRRISQMEGYLGSRLLNRTTRQLTLSETGKHFYQQASKILLDLADAEDSISQETSGLSGSLKLTAPLSFSLNHLSHAVVDFLKQYPDIELNLSLNDSNINLVEEGIDMAVRIGKLEDSSLIARRLGTINIISCASQSYLQQYGEPKSPDDLNQHFGLQYTHLNFKQQWQYLTSKGKIIYGQPKIKLQADNGELLATAAIAGIGITTAPTFILGKYIKDNKLIRILENYPSPAVGLYAIYPPGRLMPKRVRVFSDFLKKYFGNTPYWDDDIGLIF